MRGLMMDSPLTLAALLRHAARVHARREIVSRGADRSLHRYTYGDCLHRACRLGCALRALGVERGDRVATFAWNDHRHLEAYYGVPASGFVLHTLNIRLHADDLAHIANDAGDKVAIVDASVWPQFETFAGRVPFAHVIVAGAGASLPEGALDYETLIAGASPDEFADIADEQTAAAMCYTSGTTGRPKGVVYSHRSLVLHSMASVAPDLFGLSCTDTVMPVVPMFHVNGWGIPFSAAMVGAKQVLPGRHLDPASLVDLMASERVTWSAGVPTIWKGILDYLDAHRGEQDLSSLREMVVGGAAPPESLVSGLAERHGLRMTQGWGMTETSPLGSMSGDRAETASQTAAEQYRYRATQGRPIPLIEIRGRNDEGLIPWDGQTMGELEVRGPWVASAYHGVRDDAVFTEDGWFRTGDIVTIGPDAELLIQDRCKDLVKSGGEWISSVLLETHLMDHPHVAEAAVVAIAHSLWTERPLAVVVPRAGCVPDVNELQRHVADRFPKWWVPDDVVFAEALPRTATGKVRKLELRAMHAEHYSASGVSGAQAPTAPDLASMQRTSSR